MAESPSAPASPIQSSQPARRVWLLSPYHTGSHQAWAEGYARHSRHQVRLLTLEGRFWKWRMLGGAVALAQAAEQLLVTEGEGVLPDLVLATDMLNLPLWLAGVRRLLPAATPVLLYMHENQLTYPWRPGEVRDPTYALINWQSQLVADGIAFNSASHRAAWFGELPRLLKHYPDAQQLPLVEGVAARCCVLPVGIECSATAPVRDGGPPLILWNQRWEYDKRPDRFFALLYRLRAAGADFRLAVAGENFRTAPAEFEEARSRLADRIVHWGFVEGSADYRALLARADLVVSTAEHEFFGISMLEAAAAGAYPLLPNRLSYPELIPPALHEAVLYRGADDLFARALAFLRDPAAAQPIQRELRAHVRTNYGWQTVAAAMDSMVDDMIENREARIEKTAGAGSFSA